MPRVVCLVAKLAELPPSAEQRRTLALELGAGAMELLLGELAGMSIDSLVRLRPATMHACVHGGCYRYPTKLPKQGFGMSHCRKICI